MRFHLARQAPSTSPTASLAMPARKLPARVTLESPQRKGDSVSFEAIKEQTMTPPQAKEQSSQVTEAETKPVKPFDPWERYFDEDKESPLYTFGSRSAASARNRS